jgi:hypothetical protein
LWRLNLSLPTVISLLGYPKGFGRTDLLTG